RGMMGALAGGAAGAFGGAKFGGQATGHSKTSGLVGALVGAFAGSKLEDAGKDWKDGHDKKKDEEKKHKDEEKLRRDEEKLRRDDEKHDHRRRSRSSSRSSHHRRHDSGERKRDAPRSAHYGGGFTTSSRDVRLDESHGEWNLRASCKRYDGSYESSTLSLNKILENDCGSFRWYEGHHSGGGGGPRSYTVQQGDTLRAIAAKFGGTSFEEIARHNGISNPDLIYPGQTLQIPGGGGEHHGGGGHGGNFGSSARHVRLVDGGQKLEAELRRENGDWVHASIVLDERIKNDNGTLQLI
ncbi:CVNH domain-containing protein, partial [Mariannaea sp. PMI_226]